VSASRFASDVAKRLPIPIFHVNGEDVEAVVRVGRIALEWRYAFGTDVIIDVIGYRRHGHSEVDDASITQPLIYNKIKKHAPLYQIYAGEIGADAAPVVTRVRGKYEQALDEAKKREKRPVMRELPSYWANYVGGCAFPSGVDRRERTRRRISDQDRDAVSRFYTCESVW
jgi:2-oxoglutarate dehydrogenase E1 component